MIRPPLIVLAALAATSPAAAGERPRGLPAAMHGIWGYDAEACTRQDSDGRVKVEARAAEFFASACTFTRFRRGRDGTWTAHGRCAEEGDGREFPGQMAFRIVGEGRLAIDSSIGGTPHAYRRCGRDMPVR